MAGFSSVAGEDSVSIMFADNASFDGTERDGALTADKQLWVGSSSGKQVRRATLIEGSGITITQSATSPTEVNLEIAAAGGGMGIDTIITDINSPVQPNVDGEISVTGTHVFSSGPGTTLTLDVDATDNTFLYGQGNNVAMAELGPLDNGELIIGSTGGAPVAATLTGGPGITITNAAGSVTVNSVVFTDTTATTLVEDNGYFATAAGTYNLPATPAQGELIHIIADTAGAVVVDAPAGDFIRIGNVISASGGTATSNAIGDQLICRFRFSTQTWHCIPVGTWTLA